ncbi:MAG: hypothetical protein CMP08_06605 [Xanthomonadales bacterium]|nr:hypothetical protein [Xanthomonadales bacterium]
MSDTQSEPLSSVPALDEEQVAAWLVAHPDFVSRHPEAFEAQAIGHDTQGAASLIERQVARLRQTNRELAARFEELVRTARANEDRVVQLNRVARIMVGATEADALIAALSDSLQTHFGVDVTGVFLEGSAQAGINRICWLDDAPAADEALTHVRRRGKPICGELTAAQAEALFADADDDAVFTSAAFIPLGRSQVRGAIVLASRDPQRFTPDMGTLFVELFGALLTATLARLIGDDAVV